MDFAARWAVLAAGLALDRLVGDPPWLWSRLPHPVAMMGRLVGWLDRRWNLEGDRMGVRRGRGVAAAALIVGAGLGSGLALHLLFAALPFGLVLEAVALAVLLAHRSLLDHVRRVADALSRPDLEGARQAVGQIVGRDVRALDEAGIVRAAIESLAENFSDGVVAPAFWYALLGLPGLLAYKAVNTADSMIGHRSPRHAEFGWASARLDDALNFVPARLSAVLIAVAAFPQARTSEALRTAWSDAPRHASPNAGRPEAAIAGALGVALGGPRAYGARAVEGAWLNADGRREAGIADLHAALRLIDRAWALLLSLPALSVALALAQ